MCSSAFRVSGPPGPDGGGGQTCTKTFLGHVGMCVQNSSRLVQGFGFPFDLHIPTERQTNICTPIFIYRDLLQTCILGLLSSIFILLLAPETEFARTNCWASVVNLKGLQATLTLFSKALEFGEFQFWPVFREVGVSSLSYTKIKEAKVWFAVIDKYFKILPKRNSIAVSLIHFWIQRFIMKNSVLQDVFIFVFRMVNIIPTIKKWSLEILWIGNDWTSETLSGNN